MHLPGDADRPHIDREAPVGEFLPQGGDRGTERPFPVGGELFVAFGRQPRHHVVGGAAGG